MDNDNALKKKLVKLYRNTKLKIDYAGMNLTTEEGGNNLIAEKLRSNKPFMVGRFGAVEMHCVSRQMHGEKCTEVEKEQALYAAGIFPNDDGTIERFCEVYTDAMKECDALGVWKVTSEKEAVKKYCPNVSLIPSRSIEPYYYENPWSMELKGKRLLVIHPFTNTIKGQLEHLELVWEDRDVLPKLQNVSLVKAVQSNAGAKPPYKDWFEALDSMKEQIGETDFDVAIIGAGAYGLPLAAYVKSLGKQVIQMSGATQILFGIKGKRWDLHPIISKMYNDYWVRPLDEETPPQIQKVEGGSYW